MRKENNGTRYFGFDEVAKEVYNLTPPSSTLRNPAKRDELVAKFYERNKCKFCKQPMTYVGGNVLCCKNPDCKQKSQSFKLLDEKTKNLAIALFGEGEVVA